MANTKTHPGMFRCYEAALPDEPMFVILGRDPAGPATLEFWAQERVKQEKVHERDDQDRIKAAIDEAKDMADWRSRMLAHAEECGLPPVWKLPRPDEHGDDKPIRMALPQSSPDGSVLPRNEFVFDRRTGDATLIQIGDMESVALSELTDFWLANKPQPETREITMRPELAAPYGLPQTDIATDPTVREKIAIGLRQVTQDMQAYFGGDEIALPYDDWIRVKTQALTFVDRINGHAAELEASRVDPYETFAAHYRRQQAKPISYLWSPGDDEDEIRVTPLSFSRMSELLDYATCYGEFDENTPNGTQSKYGAGMSTPMNEIRRNVIWCMKRFMGIIPEGAEPPVADETEQMIVYREGLFMVPGVKEPQTMDQIAEAYRILAKPLPKAPTVDSKPEDLAHAPEVPHHRFSVFHETGDYAYARGLEVNPMHLPTALDAMAKSDWHLVAIFGQTDAQHIGFIFKKGRAQHLTYWGRPEFSAFEIAHGYGGGFEDTRPRVDEALPKGPLRAYAEGKSFEEIAKEECPDGDEECLKLIGMGRGQMP